MSTPTFSVIVPTYRRPRALAECLSTLEEQTYPRSDFEVIVVDDADMRGALEPIVRKARPIAFRLVSQAFRGAAAARNTGAQLARGRLLAFTDDDCRPDPAWLATFARHPDEQLLGGHVVNALAENAYATASQALIDFLLQALNADPESPRLLTSNNLCVPAASFRAIGGFDTAFSGAGGEDREFCLRWASTGRRSRFLREAVVHHAHAMGLAGFVRQHYAYGRGAARLRERVRVHGFGPLPLEPAAFYWELLQYPGRFPGPSAQARGFALFALSQLANTGGYFHERVAQRSRSFFTNTRG